VYKAFTNANLLIGAVNQTMARPTPPCRPTAWFTEQLDEPDPMRRCSSHPQRPTHKQRAGQPQRLRAAPQP
jgi:hypothetical protein